MNNFFSFLFFLAKRSPYLFSWLLTPIIYIGSVIGAFNCLWYGFYLQTILLTTVGTAMAFAFIEHSDEAVNLYRLLKKDYRQAKILPPAKLING